MKWRGRRQSTNMDDRRGVSGGKLAIGGGAIGLIYLLINMFMGGDVSVSDFEQQVTNPTTPGSAIPANDTINAFVRVIQADTEEVWKKIFAENGMTYKEPTMVLFTDAVNTGCGGASAALGPFYCPADQTVYMDMAFFKELENRFGAKGGDFAIAYVIAHEIGHHIQTLVGTSAKVREMQQGMNEADANVLSVALELQADFYAGLWAHYNQKRTQFLEEGDIEEALSAANAVGDDAIQSKTRGSVDQESFTHGSSRQRMYWFNLGFQSGDIKKGNTFENVH